MDDNTLLLASRVHQWRCGKALGIGKEGLRYGAFQMTLLFLSNKTSEAADVLWVSPVRGVASSVVPSIAWKPCSSETVTGPDTIIPSALTSASSLPFAFMNASAAPFAFASNIPRSL